jgi:hypothetical protein
MSRRITPTYILLNQITLAAATSSVIFSNIPQDYQDLVLVIDGAGSNNATVRIRFNSDSGSSYSFVWANGNGSSATSASGTSNTSLTQTYLFTSKTTNIVQIMDYSASNRHKTVISRYNNPSLSLQINAERWANTAAISSILCLQDGGGTMNIGTMLSLYGIAA